MLFDFLGDVRHWPDITDAANAKIAADFAEATAREVRGQVDRLQRQVDQLRLALMAISEIAQTRFGVTDEQVLEKMTEIDLRDGQLDGRLTSPAATCPECRHVNSPHRDLCLYCGAAMSEKAL
ncbi:MAG TPA: zinc ribbon domain-containing protein [Planctomycetaceae bacterium]|nr:zinc ribbon domain-containing protein [Planctomycetaceae bacterium]